MQFLASRFRTFFIILNETSSSRLIEPVLVISFFLTTVFRWSSSCNPFHLSDIIALLSLKCFFVSFIASNIRFVKNYKYIRSSENDNKKKAKVTTL